MALRTQDFYCHLNPSFFILKKKEKKEKEKEKDVH
jgi:hypothetical protein